MLADAPKTTEETNISTEHLRWIMKNKTNTYTTFQFKLVSSS